MVIKDRSFETHEEYLQAVDLLVPQRNARANKAGFSPDQRTFGRNLRLPGHMLSSDKLDSDLSGVNATDEIRRMWDIQDASARACVTRRSKEACSAALKDTRRRRWQETPLAEGSWKMVWRQPSELEKGDWEGPGILLTMNHKGTTCFAYVAGRLW